MEISIHRTQNYFDNCFSRGSPLAVFFNGKPVARVATGETLALGLPDVPGTLQVFLLDCANVPYIGRYAYDNMTPSNPLEIFPGPTIQQFLVRTRPWVFFDVLDLALLKSMRGQILLLEPCVNEGRST